MRNNLERMRDPYDFFPGDPPIAEVTLILSAIIAATLLLVLVFRLVLARLRNRPVRFFGLGLFLAMALPLLAALPIEGKARARPFARRPADVAAARYRRPRRMPVTAPSNTSVIIASTSGTMRPAWCDEPKPQAPFRV